MNTNPNHPPDAAAAPLGPQEPPEPEPHVEALMDRASDWQAQFFDDEIRKWSFTAREIEARQLIADLMLCVAYTLPVESAPAAPLGDVPAPAKDEFRWLREEMREVADQVNATIPMAANYLRRGAHALLILQQDAAASRVVPAPPKDEWQPIETAPRDGTVFLGWAVRETYPSMARWHKGRYRTVLEEVAMREHGSWSGWPLTYWQPLPSPPSAADPVPPQEQK